MNYIKKILKAFNDEFVTNNGMLISDSQTSYVLALQFDLLFKKNREIAVERLIDNINDYGHLTTGFLGTPFCVMFYPDNGKHAKAIELLLRKEYPSWLYPVTKGPLLYGSVGMGLSQMEVSISKYELI